MHTLEKIKNRLLGPDVRPFQEVVRVDFEGNDFSFNLYQDGKTFYNYVPTDRHIVVTNVYMPKNAVYREMLDAGGVLMRVKKQQPDGRRPPRGLVKRDGIMGAILRKAGLTCDIK